MKWNVICRGGCIALTFCMLGALNGMQKLLKTSKIFNTRSITLINKCEKQNNNIIALYTIRKNRPEYRICKKTIEMYLRLKDPHGLNFALNDAIKYEKQMDNPDIPKLLGVLLSRLTPEKFVLLVNMHNRNSLWKQSYAWDGMVLDTFFQNMHLFEEDKIHEILGLVVRYKPQNFGMYWWCSKNLKLAYHYIGSDALKKLYDSADDDEKHVMINAYRPLQKEFHKEGRPIYFLDQIITFKDWKVGDNC